MENSMEVSQETKNRITTWPSNSIPEYIPKRTKTLNQKDTCIPMFIAALFTIAKIWKQPKCPPTDEWIKKMWYRYTMEYSHKKEWNNAICNNMDGLRGYSVKWNKSGRERQIPYDITYMWNLKYDTNEPINKTETDPQT